jgi:hypothetical protein
MAIEMYAKTEQLQHKPQLYIYIKNTIRHQTQATKIKDENILTEFL